MDREDRQMTREGAQKILDVLMPELKLPDPRTEEEFLTELQPITELEELREEIHTETIIAMYLGDQLNLKKKFIHELYEKERALKNEMG